MKFQVLVIIALLYTGVVFNSNVEAAGTNKLLPVFVKSPEVTVDGDTFNITFTVSTACDAAVWVEDSNSRIIRRLAVGLLGPNAPEPFQKNTLFQKLSWDGKDEHGQPVLTGSTVHVGLGLKADFSRMLYEMAPGIAARGPASIACDKNGRLYIIWGHMRSGNLGGITVNITAFDRDGKYSSTVMPFRSDYPKKKISAVEFLDTADNRRIPLTGPNRHSPVVGFLPGMKNIARHNALITSDGRYIFPSGRPVADVDGKEEYRLVILGTDGSCAGKVYAGPPMHEGATTGEKFLALSPDEKFVYTSRTYHMGRRKRGHCVYRIGLNDKTPPKPFVGVLCESGDDNDHFRDPRGVATDSAGRLYVCDYQNDRVQIFSKTGKYLKTLSLPGPEQIVIHPKTGVLYVLSIGDRGAMETYVTKRWEIFADKTIVKYESFEKLEEVARCDFPKRPRYFHDCGPILALDSSAKEPVLWLCNAVRGAPSDFLWKIVDKGSAFEILNHNIRGQTNLASMACPLVAAARDHDEFYLAGGDIVGVMRAMAGSGKLESFPVPEGAADWLGAIQAGSDGTLYMSCGKELASPKDMRWVIKRYSRSGKLLPFKDKEGLETFGYHTGTHSGEMCGPFAVAPNNNIYVSECSTPDGKALARVNVYGPDGILIKQGLISETTHTAPPLAIDGQGRLYVADSVKRKGVGAGNEFPSFLGRDPRRHFGTWYGTVCRFGSGGGAFRHVKEDQAYTHKGGWPGGKGLITLEGAAWEYFGMSPMPQSSTCECKVGRLDADGFGRVFVPDVLTHSVQVLDPAGNLILRFGAYGNWDAKGTGSEISEPPIPLYYPLMVAALDGRL